MIRRLITFVITAAAVFFFVVVPMNALLQHRGYVLLSAGHSIAVQNFNENLSILAMLGLVSARQLWRWNRYAIILFSVAGAVLTPGDLVLGQLAMAGALTVLYNLSIVIALIVGRRRKEAEPAAT